MEPTVYAMILAAGFFAGFVDAIIGGGGLIQLPALLIAMPEQALSWVFGTNKLGALAGTATAAVRYMKQTAIDRKVIVPAVAAAAIFSWFGALTVSVADKNRIKPFILVLFILVFIHTFLKKNSGEGGLPRFNDIAKPFASFAVGAIIGFYDGFFGPGTGNFLVFIFLTLFGMNFLTASAHAKLVNTVTNIGAIICFASYGGIDVKLGLMLATVNIAGAYLGAHLAIRKGNQFIRRVFLLVLISYIVRMSYDLLATYKLL